MGFDFRGQHKLEILKVSNFMCSSLNDEFVLKALKISYAETFLISIVSQSSQVVVVVVGLVVVVVMLILLLLLLLLLLMLVQEI